LDRKQFEDVSTFQRFILFIGVYHNFSQTTYTICARGDILNTQLNHHANGKINIILREQHTDKPHSNAKQLKVIHRELKWVDDELSNFIGLVELKKILKEIYATKLMNEKREQMGLTINNQVLHMIFQGNPGTGKTTIARALATILYKLHILSKGHFIEAERADLVGEYIGQTAQKTRNLVEKSLGGILFIDEAYSLARGGHKDFGREAIDTLVKQMEDHSHDFMLILAGYPSEMEHFLKMNPGLTSRFPFHVGFDDFDLEQLTDIAKQIAKEREYELCDSAIWKLRTHLREQLLKIENEFADARSVRNVIESAILMQAIRLSNKEHCTLKELMLIKAEDVHFDR